ncbi:uncharacterized protein PAC_16384 [Phialocephala subalpina]|uniref:Heterokaryon incompatibility domain-containing protein n=1 Tax=Phialocephala subalpina TaxID=576137 RepID=A0A1L7XN72_9HELO|nr:uncharacterized protein PAC_16384 [Phialocephala subalpina]
MYGENEIQVLEILPGTESSIIQCQLEHIILGRPAQYNALSYTWGDPIALRIEITVNGHKLRVTENCKLALQELRREAKVNSKIQVIWIDAICINQGDPEERRQQVLIMRSIYIGAQNLIIWLGPEADDSVKAIEILTKFVRCECEGPKHLQEWQKYFEGPSRYKHWLSIAKFFSRSWFRRVWVVQEYTAFANKNEPEFYCRSNRLKRSAINLAALAGDFWMNTSPIYPPGKEYKADNEYVSRARAVYPTFSGGLRCIMGMAVDSIKRPRVAADAALYLFAKIFVNTERQATDPRDIIYAHLHSIPEIDPDSDLQEAKAYKDLVRSTSNGFAVVETGEISRYVIPYLPDLIVDYNASLEDVSASLVQYIVHATNKLNILSLCYQDSTYKSRKWALDLSSLSWHTPGSILAGTFLFASRHDSFRASKAVDASATFSDNLSILSIKGFRWSKVQRVFQDLLPGVEDQDQITGYIQPRLAKVILNYSMEVGFCGTLKEAALAFVEAHSSSSNQSGHPKTSNPDHSSRTPFLTENGNFGYGWRWVRIRDYVCVILGCDVPLILRPSLDCWELIGDCYVPGIMKGEAMEELKNARVELTTFDCI